MRDDPDTVVVVEACDDPDVAPIETWAAAGLRRLRLRWWAADATAHDYVVGRDGHADATVRLIDRARASDVVVVVETEVHRSTFRGLHELPRALLARGVKRWDLVWPRGDDLSRTVPRLGLAVPHALRACAIAGRLGLEVRLIDFPLCVLGPMRRAARRSNGRVEPPRTPPCTACPARSQCPGPGPAYVTRHGIRELHALAD